MDQTKKQRLAFWEGQRNSVGAKIRAGSIDVFKGAELLAEIDRHLAEHRKWRAVLADETLAEDFPPPVAAPAGTTSGLTSPAKRMGTFLAAVIHARTTGQRVHMGIPGLVDRHAMHAERAATLAQLAKFNAAMSRPRL